MEVLIRLFKCLLIIIVPFFIYIIVLLEKREGYTPHCSLSSDRAEIDGLLIQRLTANNLDRIQEFVGIDCKEVWIQREFRYVSRLWGCVQQIHPSEHYSVCFRFPTQHEYDPMGEDVKHWTMDDFAADRDRLWKVHDHLNLRLEGESRGARSTYPGVVYFGVLSDYEVKTRFYLDVYKASMDRFEYFRKDRGKCDLAVALVPLAKELPLSK
jgi:hypothetical protein